MKGKYLWPMMFAVVAALFFLCVPRVWFSFVKSNDTSVGVLSLITEPDDGMAPVLTTIRGATRSVDLVMYELDDAQIEAALAADEKRGVAVRVILSAGYQGASSTENASAYNFLAANGVSVRWSPAYFSLTHQKSLVVDGDRALIMTFNLVSKYYATGRDFGIFDGDARDVAAITQTFDGDWQGSGVGLASAGSDRTGGNNGERGDDLVWSPGSRPAILNLINDAHASLLVYNEEMADPAVVKALIDASARGVAVYVDMTAALEWEWQFKELTAGGVHLHTYADTPSAPLYIHAKIIVADGVRAFVGSENFSGTSLDQNRELGIITSDQAIVTSLSRTFNADW